MRHVGRGAVGLLVVVVLGVAAAACSGNTRADSATATAADPAKTRQMALMAAGLLPKQDDDAIQFAMSDGQEALIRDCMRAKGFTYYPKPARTLIDTVTESDFGSADYAKTYGFGVTGFPTFAKLPDQNVPYYGSLSADRQQAYTPTMSACADAAAGQVNAEYAVKPGNALFDKVQDEVTASGEYQASLRTWQACAAKAGLDYPSRKHLIDALQKRLDAIKQRLSTKAHDQSALTDLLAKDPEFIKLHGDEIAAATATFPCSQAADAVYARLFRAALDKLG